MLTTDLAPNGHTHNFDNMTTTAPKRRGRPAGSKNKTTRTTKASSKASSSVHGEVARFLNSKDIQEFFSLPEDVQVSVKRLVEWAKTSTDTHPTTDTGIDFESL
jgi:hypothetical protein